MLSRQLDFTDVSLYAVTGPMTDTARTVERVRAVLAGGADAVQLRSRELSDAAFLALGADLRRLCAERSALFIVNNRVDLAIALDADGVHLGHDDMPIGKAREMVGHRKLIGASTHSLPQALAAQKAGADYVSCGPLWATPTKPDYAAVGLGLIGLYRAALKVPFVAIGGIDESNIDQVAAAGARTVAVVRALFDADDPEEKARFFKSKMPPAEAAQSR